MNTSPSQPESTSHALETPTTPSHVVQVQQPSALPVERQPPPSQLSWGEHLLPFLFAAMETCWIDAILVGLVSSDVLGLSQPLIPLWTLFVLIAGFYYLSRYLDGQGIATSNNTSSSVHTSTLSTRPVIIALAVLATCTVVWTSVYSSRVFLLDPGWVLNLPDALAQVNAESFQNSHYRDYRLLALSSWDTACTEPHQPAASLQSHTFWCHRYCRANRCTHHCGEFWQDLFRWGIDLAAHCPLLLPLAYRPCSLTGSICALPPSYRSIRQC